MLELRLHSCIALESDLIYNFSVALYEFETYRRLKS
jgi:hypothetical protein